MKSGITNPQTGKDYLVDEFNALPDAVKRVAIDPEGIYETADKIKKSSNKNMSTAVRPPRYLW